MIDFPEFVENEFIAYRAAMLSEGITPFDFDDWYAGADYLDSMYQQLTHTKETP